MENAGNHELRTDSRTREAIYSKIKVKDTVFTDLFGDARYLLQLYKALHPEDESVTEADLKNVTCKSVLTNRLYNDLGFRARDSLIILVEAQSTWSRAVVARLFMYLALTYVDYFYEDDERYRSLYSNKDLQNPEAELYVIYTGERLQNRPEFLTWREDVAHGRPGLMNFPVKVLYDGKPGDIINHYVTYCKILDAQRALTGSSVKTAVETIRKCRELGVLKEYLDSRRSETMINLMTEPFDQETIIRGMVKEERREARQEGIAMGERRKSIAIARRMLGRGTDTLEEVAGFTGLTLPEVEALARGEEIE